jgi:hypothetical protein
MSPRLFVELIQAQSANDPRQKRSNDEDQEASVLRRRFARSGSRGPSAAAAAEE